jgi:hypothetical protein
MNRKIHVLLDIHGLVGTNQRPFHEVVALAVAVEAKFGWQTVLAHIVVVVLGDLGARHPRLEQT